jgi:hypothetical protein
MRNVAVLPPVKSEWRGALLKLSDFENFATHELIAMARALPGGTKVHIPDRLTAIVLLLGTAPLHPIAYGKIFEPNTVVVRTLP